MKILAAALRNDGPPLLLWERSDRIVRCDLGEGLRPLVGPKASSPGAARRPLPGGER